MGFVRLMMDRPSCSSLLNFKSGHQGLDKQKPRDGLVTKVSFLIPRGLCNVHALMAVSDPMGKGRDTSLVQLVRQGAWQSQSAKNTVYFLRWKVTEWPLPAHPI